MLPTIPSGRSGHLPSLVDLALPTPSSRKTDPIQDATLVIHGSDEADIVEPSSSCCCAPPRGQQAQQQKHRRTNGGSLQQQRRAPVDSKITKAAAKYTAALAESSAVCKVPEEALQGLIAKLVVLQHPSDRWAALNGQQLDSVEAITAWRKDCRRLGRLRGKLGEKESSHSKLMSIRPSSVKTNEVAGYQGLYQAMMRLRVDVTHLKSQKESAQEAVDRREATTVHVGGTPVPTIRVAYLYQLQLAVQHEQAAGGWWAKKRRTAGGGVSLAVLDTPRGTDESAKSRATDQSIGA